MYCSISHHTTTHWLRIRYICFHRISAKYLFFSFRVVTKNWMKVAESVLVAACSAIILTLLIYSVPDCQPIKGFHPPNPNDTTHLPINHTDTSAGRLTHHKLTNQKH